MRNGQINPKKMNDVKKNKQKKNHNKEQKKMTWRKTRFLIEIVFDYIRRIKIEVFFFYRLKHYISHKQ